MGNDDSGTRVDLGDDLLLEKTVVQRPEEPAPHRSQTPVEELLSNAKILLSEGWIEDAKKTLRRVLILDRKNAFAQEMLREILQGEEKHLLSFESEPKKRRSRARVEVSDESLSELERELSAETEELPKIQVIEEGEASPADRIDLGIGLLEMGFFDEAAAQFRVAARAFALSGEVGAERSAHALFAQAQLEAGRPLEAILALQPVIKNPEIAPADKLEFLYLMGRANAAQGRRDVALQWFERVRELDPNYRDVEERLKTKAGPS